jgi:2'-hydroxyisoflavone reductase
MRILVLGGTRFLGRAFVEAALAREHTLTLFNRGRTNPDLFPEAEKIRGDREHDLSALDGRRWDAVVDVATFLPRVVRLSVDALADSCDRYVYVSSISVYASFERPPVEGAPLAETDSTEETLENYGAFKAQCERIVEDAFGERALIVRPGLIVGPHDPTDRFTYWPRRIADGGEVLAPGSPDDPVQFVDVRDLGEWILHMVEGEQSGVFNATGRPLPFGRFLDEARDALGSDATFTWIPSEELLASDVEPWTELPLWLPPDMRAMQEADVSRALAARLTFRPVAETMRDTLAWDRAREIPRAEGVGLARERESALLSDRRRAREPSARRRA